MDVDYRGIFGSEWSLMKRNTDEAQSFAESQNKVAVPISARIHRVGILADWAWFYYKFSLEEPGSDKSRIKFEDIVVERDPRLSEEFYANRHSIDKSNNIEAPSKYDELIKLDELRKKEIISEDEFQAEKENILKGK